MAPIIANSQTPNLANSRAPKQVPSFPFRNITVLDRNAAHARHNISWCNWFNNPTCIKAMYLVACTGSGGISLVLSYTLQNLDQISGDALKWGGVALVISGIIPIALMCQGGTDENDG